MGGLGLNSVLLTCNKAILNCIYYQIKKNWYSNLGLLYNYGLSNILNTSIEEKSFAVRKDVFNSLLYRQDKVKINSITIKLGITYMF